MALRKKVVYVQVDENGTEHQRIAGWAARSFVPQTADWYVPHDGACATETDGLVRRMTLLMVEPSESLYPFGAEPVGTVANTPQPVRVKLRDEHGLHPGFAATLELSVDAEGVWRATGLDTVVREAQAAHLPLPWKLELDT